MFLCFHSTPSHKPVVVSHKSPSLNKTQNTQASLAETDGGATDRTAPSPTPHTNPMPFYHHHHLAVANTITQQQQQHQLQHHRLSTTTTTTATLPEGSAGAEIERAIEDEWCEHTHHSNRAPWLRALVLGANDGLVSTASLLMGVGSGSTDLAVLRLSGVASLLAGALSMAVGEYVSVSSQRDAERADIEKEIMEQLKGPEAQARELDELTQIYVERGVPGDLARQVAVVLTEKDVIRAHARDELGIDLDELANPLQAAVVSAMTFTLGAAIPLLSAIFLGDPTSRLIAIALSTTAGLYVGFFLCLYYFFTRVFFAYRYRPWYV